jgi:hypothetical protein
MGGKQGGACEKPPKGVLLSQDLEGGTSVAWVVSRVGGSARRRVDAYALSLWGLVLGPGCVTGLSSPLERVPSVQNQSCMLNPACMAPAASGELLVPTTSSAVRAVQAMRGLLTLKDLLDEAEVARVEAMLVQCAREADFKINEREYPREKFPNDSECGRKVGQDKNGEPVTRAMELGAMKHEWAFACVERVMGRDVAEHLTREPRYGKDPSSGAYGLTEEFVGSLVPDIVLHVVRDANRIQFLYDFLFPCTSKSKSDPLGPGRRLLLKKLEKYEPLTGQQSRALVTPQLGISR